MAAPVRSSVLPRALTAGVAALALLSSQSPAIAKVGVAAAVNTDARGRTPGGAPRVISLGQTVIFNEEIVTDARGLVQVLLLDGTTFTVGPNSQLTIDEFVYNPATGDAKVVATVAKGAFRFIGGQTSRRGDGATINTPVGTIGIRGAMVEGRVDSSDQALFSMIFGDEVNFRGRDGKRSRIYEPGYTLVVRGTNGGGVDTNVRRRNEGDASTFQTALAGGDGQTGGASETPDDETVQNSQVPQSNSNLPSSVPIPTPRSIAVKSSDIEEVETKVSDLDTRGTVLPPQPTPGIVYYVPDPNAMSGFSIMSFGTPQPFTEEVKEFVITGDRLASVDGTVDLPDYTGTQGDEGLEEFVVTDGIFSGNTLTGMAYAGRGDFAAYLLEYGGDTTYPFYMIHGTGTELTAAPENTSLSDIRQYSLTTDPSTGGVPFFAPTEYGLVTNASATNFYMVEPGASSTGEFETFMSWISIEGEGLNQKSAAFVTASANGEDDFGADNLYGSRRGSFRASSDTGAVNMRGTLSTLAGPDGSHFFGDNADHFVIGSSLDPNDAFFDISVDGENNATFGSHHVASLVEETPQTEYERTSKTVTGFMAGVAESSSNPDSPNALTSAGGTNFYLELNATNHSVSAVGLLNSWDILDEDEEIDSYLLTFGGAPTAELDLGPFDPLITTGEGATGGSTYVAWDIYGAVQNNDPSNTRINILGEYLGEYVEVEHTDTANPGSYMVSGRAVPIAGYTHCDDCDFIDWGWWGTRVVVLPDENDALPNGRRDFVHMGTWVAGDITAEVDMPINVRATYEGTMLGTVVSHQGEGEVSQYIAAGTFGMTYNFNDRAGEFWIDDFDGYYLEGQAYSDGDMSRNFFYAENDGGEGASFTVSGAFVNNGQEIAAGVIGDFTINDYGFYAVGTIAGKQTERVEFVTARVLTAPEFFVPIDTEDSYANAGDRGLIGTTEESDRIVTLDKSTVNVQLINQEIGMILPDLTGTEGDEGLEAISVSGWAADGESIDGTAYAGAGDFVAYVMGFGGDATQPFYAIVGTPTSNEVVSSLNTGTNVREYTLTQDPIEGIDAPFFFDDRFGPIAANSLSSTNLFIVEADTAENYGVEEINPDAKAFQSWVSIEGDGVAQKSAAMVFASSIGIDSNGEASLESGRRGSFRWNAYAGPANMRGSIAAIEGASGNVFFGDNANNFVLGADVDTSDSYNDSLLGPGFTGDPSEGYIGTGYPFSTHHVADLVDTTPQADLGRTSRTVTGYMSGMVESNIEWIDNPFSVSSGVQPTFTLSLDAQTNDVSASATLFDAVIAPNIYSDLEMVFNPNEAVAGYELAFGPGVESGGGSAFVDDNLFAARQNNDNANTRVNFDDVDETSAPNISGDNPGSYIVSGRANPIEGYAHCTDCSFLDWGWWGTRVTVDDPNEEGQRRDYVHMGTWVAGDITSDDDMPVNISATYEGTALANIRRDGEGGFANYIAAGTMDMSFDFNSRLGEVNIDIDGLQLFSEVNGNVSGLGQSHFAGGMNMVDSDISGGLSGAFVNNGNPLAGGTAAGGVIGNFTFEGENRLATGTIAGRQTGTSPLP